MNVNRDLWRSDEDILNPLIECVAALVWGYFIIAIEMTRLERKQAELDKLYEYRAAAMRKNDFMWMQRNQAKIDALEKEIIEMRRNEHQTVFSVLSDKDECVKNGVYKALLTISLMADATNEACENASELMAKYGITSFGFKNKVKELKRLSQEIASVTLANPSKLMEDFIVNDDTFVDMCMKHANAHLKRKLKL